MAVSTKKSAQLALIAQMYYEERKNQQEISEKTGINRSAISRLLTEARLKGIVDIKINYPWRDIELEKKFQTAFPQLKKVYIPACTDSSYETMNQTLGFFAAKYFMKKVKQGMIVGLAWGKAIYEMIHNIPYEPLDIEIVQITGATGHEDYIKGGPLLSRLLSDKLGCSCQYLHVPFIVENQMLSEAMKKEKVICQTLEYAKKSDFTFTGLGSTKKDLYTLKETGYITDKEWIEIKKTGAVGDYLGVHYNINGKVLDISINKRLIGNSPEDLKDVENRVAIAGGQRKAEAILGAINGHFFNILITDNFTAERILDIK
ncbi:MAG: sugar-binding transcriptional regulator [Spirochaetales bacterium]|nr:sugar-binding transcriptional regulator [Spirochaetales bacterium]